jgi:outer membrane protein
MKYEMRNFGIILILSMGLASGVQAQSSDTLTLAQAVQMAIRNSPSFAEGEAAIDRAKAQYRETESYAYPQLAADASYTRIDPVISIPFGSQVFVTQPNNNYNGNLNMQQPLWSFGRFEAEDKVAESGIKSATDNLDQFRAQAAYQTTQAYYNLLTADEGIRVEQEQVKVLEGNLSDARKREQQGTATSLDTLNIQARISQTQSQIDELESTRRKQASMLRRLLGMAPGTSVNVTRPPTALSLPEREDTLESLAEKQRPELIAAEDAENTAKFQIDAASNNNDPLLTTNVVGGVKDGYLPNLTQPKLNWAGTVSLHVPILDGGRTHAQVDEAAAEYRAAQARTEDAKRGVQNDIEQALADLQSSRLRLGLTKFQIEQARQAYNIAQVRYQNGAATNLDVLTAQSALEQAELNQAQLMFSLELSEYNLNRAVGTPMW